MMMSLSKPLPAGLGNARAESRGDWLYVDGTSSGGCSDGLFFPYSRGVPRSIFPFESFILQFEMHGDPYGFLFKLSSAAAAPAAPLATVIGRGNLSFLVKVQMKVMEGNGRERRAAAS